MDSHPKNYDPVKIYPTPEQIPQPGNRNFLEKLFPKVKPEIRSLILPVIFLVIISFLVVGLILIANKPKVSNLPPTQIPISTVEPTPVPNPTENWKTYENEELGFTLKYPKEWNEVGTGEFELGSGTKIESADKSFSLGLLTGINKGYSYEKNKEFIYMFKQGGGEVAEVTGGIASKTEVNYQGAKTITSFILSDKNEVYSLSLVSSDKNNLTNSIFDQILSTFRFLD